jgi:HTH-type transcriptional regulator / antitoxin HigA
MSKANEKSKPFKPDYMVAPGESLADLLEEREMTQAALAERLGVSNKHVNQVVKGSATVSAELALGLEKVFGVAADFWLRMESQYRAHLAREAEAKSLRQWVGWAEKFPLKELRKREYLVKQSSEEGLVSELLSLFGIANVEQWSQPAVSYRKSQKLKSDEYALAAWLRIGELEAQQIECAPFDAERFRDALEKARELTKLDIVESNEKLVELCAECGVAVVIVEHFKEAKVNGATKWLTPHKALIQLSLRYKWEDIFWFTFFHEAGHVLMHRKKLLLVDEDKGPKLDPKLAALEDEANRFAARTMVPSRFDQRMRAVSVAEIPVLAKQIGVSPAVVVGRLQHDELLNYNEGNHLRRRYEFREPAN